MSERRSREDGREQTLTCSTEPSPGTKYNGNSKRQTCHVTEANKRVDAIIGISASISRFPATSLKLATFQLEKTKTNQLIAMFALAARRVVAK